MMITAMTILAFLVLLVVVARLVRLSDPRSPADDGGYTFTAARRECSAHRLPAYEGAHEETYEAAQRASGDQTQPAQLDREVVRAGGGGHGCLQSDHAVA